MNYLKLSILMLVGLFSISKGIAQANASLAVLTQNSGVVGVGEVVNIQLNIINTGPVSSIGVNKVRCQLSVPGAIVTIVPNAEQTGLPPGWIILTNNGSVITVCNGTDVIPVNESRVVLVKVQGTAIGGPSTVLGNLSFGPGTGVCTGPGTLPGDNTADNSSSSSVTVTSPTPLTLTDFTSTLVNCEPVLKWKTENEINSDRFEIERSDATNNSWKLLGTLTANATSASAKTTYTFADANLNATSARVLYRLKIIDKDGSHKYSNVLPVFVNCNTVQVNVYPNPVQDGRLYVSLTGTTGKTDATLMSIAGQVISRNKVTNGTNYLDVSAVANGSYVLNVKDASGVDKKVKVIIQK